MKVGYARKSREKQDLATQIKMLSDCGVNIDDIYSDSESGATQADTRPGFSELKKRIAAGGLSELVVTEFSRIGRDAKDSIYEMLSINRCGIKITSLADNEKFISDLPAEAQMPMISMMGMGADIERKHISERTRWSLALIKAGQKPTKSGKPLGRPEVTVDWKKIDELKSKHGINDTAARKLLGYKASTFYKKKKEAGVK